MIEPPSYFSSYAILICQVCKYNSGKMLHCSYLHTNSSILPAASRGQNTSLFMTHAQRSLRFCGGFFDLCLMNEEE